MNIRNLSLAQPISWCAEPLKAKDVYCAKHVFGTLCAIQGTGLFVFFSFVLFHNGIVAQL